MKKVIHCSSWLISQHKSPTQNSFQHICEEWDIPLNVYRLETTRKQQAGNMNIYNTYVKTKQMNLKNTNHFVGLLILIYIYIYRGRVMDWFLSQPGFDLSYGNLVCLATLMSSDSTKQICLWMTIHIYIILLIIISHALACCSV